MIDYKKYFKRTLNEDGPGYVASVPNTAGRGGAVGNSPLMYQNGTASSTGNDTSPNDYRNPFGMGVKKRSPTKRKKRKNKK